MKRLFSSYLKDGVLSRKNQILLLLGLFSARREEEPLIVVAEIAADEFISIEEQADIISSAIISRGIPTWLSGIEALNIVAKRQQLTPKDSIHSNTTFQTIEECVHYYKTEFKDIPEWVNYLINYAPEILLHYSNLRTVALGDHEVSRLLKELLLYAINVCDRYPKGIAIHKTNAIQLGATEELLRNVRELCVLAVGGGAINEPN